MTKKQIEKKAQECLELVSLEVPVPVIEIANKLGLEVHEVEMPREEQLSEITVALVKNSLQWLILVNQEDTPTRKRFAIAYAIGHFILHQNKEQITSFISGETNVRKDEATAEEKDARYFALALLLPRLELKEVWHETQNEQEIADKFYVSKSSLAARLQALNLVEGIL